MVSVVGEDFPDEHRQLLMDQGIDIEGLEMKPGKTFSWSGKYSADMNSRETIDVQLNTFGDFAPKLPESYRSAPFTFLANGAPSTQASVLDQIEGSTFAVADTMDLWIDNANDDLMALLQRIDGLILNDEEAKMLTGRRT